MKVKLGKIFTQHLKQFPQSDKSIIYEFIRHIHLHGFNGLLGKNKSSIDVPIDDPDFLKKVEFVREHNLWHYHIGIPSYDLSPNGYSTSQYVLHYIRQEDYIVIVDMSDHSPFELPDQSYLEFI